MCFTLNINLLDKAHTWMRVLQRENRWEEFGGRRKRMQLDRMASGPRSPVEVVDYISTD